MSFFTNFYLLLTGFGLGLLISAPVGPVNILCIQRSLARGFWAGVAVGFGALMADMIIAMTAALGLSAILDLMNSYEFVIQLIGGVILIGFGVHLFFSPPHMLEETDRSFTPFRHFGALPQSFLLTITNPGAILGIFAVVGSAGSAVGGLETFTEAFLLLGGLLVGATLWWLGLARLVSYFRKKMTEKRLTFINQSAGVILLVCGVALIVNSLFFV